MTEYIERETVLERAEYDNNYRLIIPAEAIKLLQPPTLRRLCMGGGCTAITMILATYVPSAIGIAK